MIHSSHIDATVVPGRCDCKAGDLVASRYIVEKALGEGSFGVVYKVKDNAGKPWAMKLLRLWDVPSTIRQPLISRFEMEYKTSCIKSNNLVHSVDFGYLNGKCSLARSGWSDYGYYFTFSKKSRAHLVTFSRRIFSLS